ncbi:MAG TPA: Na+/galactose cotransporter, partial [Terriglobia bacterium]|nr:Na+/galactose cotransporter [Terriglobia bacterium]
GFASIMDYVQALFAIFIAPLFGTVLLGMLWRRITGKGAFWGLLAGTTASASMFLAVKFHPAALSIIALSPHAKMMAEDMYQALWAWLICIGVTVVISLLTQPRTSAELKGLVYGETEIPSEGHLPFYQRPLFWSGVCLVLFLVLQWIFW